MNDFAIQPDFLKQLEDNLPFFSKQHRRLANFILRNHRKAAFMNTAQMAEEAGVSPATVVRFSTSIGFEGFPQLQKKLQEISQSSTNTNEFLRVSSQGMGEPLSDTVEQSIKALLTFKDEMDVSSFNKAVEILYKSRKILTVGHKASFGVAVQAAYTLGKIHSDVNYLNSTDEFSAFSQIEDMGEQDCALIFTVIYYPRTTLKLIRMLAKRGVKIVIVSDFRTFAEIELASVSLLVPIFFQGFIDMVGPMLTVADALTYGVFKKDEVRAKERLKKFNKFNEEDGAFLQIGRFVD